MSQLQQGSTTRITGESDSARTDALRWAGLLDLPLVNQELDNWCWSAISTNAANMYGCTDTQGRAWRQCSTASAALCKACCSDWGPCDAQIALETGMEAVGLSVRSRSTGCLAWTELQTWLDRGRLICARFAPTAQSSRGHFVAMFDLTTTTPAWVALFDPERGRVERRYDDLLEGYRSMVWTHSYIIDAPALVS